MRELAVYLHGTFIGTIKETRTGGRFAYADAIVESHPGSPLLSASLPVKKRPFGEAKTANWFEGLLPEGRRREEACRSLGINAYDWIGLLAEIGWECAGAVSIYDAKDEEDHGGSYKQCGPQELARIVSQLPSWEPQIETGSLYGKPTVPTVAPLYDVVPIAEVEPRTRLLSLRINGSLKPEDVTRDALIAEARSWGMPIKDAADALDACLSDLVRGLAVAGKRFPKASDRHESAARRRIESLGGSSPR